MFIYIIIIARKVKAAPRRRGAAAPQAESRRAEPRRSLLSGSVARLCPCVATLCEAYALARALRFSCHNLPAPVTKAEDSCREATGRLRFCSSNPRQSWYMRGYRRWHGAGFAERSSAATTCCECKLWRSRAEAKPTPTLGSVALASRNCSTLTY
jgi:hypothetical protein